MIQTLEEFRDVVDDIEVDQAVLHAEHAFSVAPNLGQFLIFASGRATEGYSPTDYKGILAMAERFQVAVVEGGAYSSVQLVEHAKAGDVLDAARSVSVAGMALAGHGSMEAYWTENESRFPTWRAIAEELTHLKLGELWQLTCSHIPRDRGLVAPVLTALAARLSLVRSAPGAILDEKLTDFESILHPVFNDEESLYEQLVRLNQQCQGSKNILDRHGKTIATKPC